MVNSRIAVGPKPRTGRRHARAARDAFPCGFWCRRLQVPKLEREGVTHGPPVTPSRAGFGTGAFSTYARQIRVSAFVFTFAEVWAQR